MKTTTETTSREIRARAGSLLGRLVAVAACAAWPVAAFQDAAQAPATAAIVYLDDGSSLPLHDWKLSYEYQVWARGESAALATLSRLESDELWVGKRRWPTAGHTLELIYEGRRAGAPEEVPRAVKVLRLVSGATSRELKLEAPARELILGESAAKPTPQPKPKDLLLVVRSLDLRGQTLTGTRRELCVLSYSTLVQCGGTASERVVKIEFPG